MLPVLNDFLVKYNIKPEEFEATKLNWEDLDLIYKDYLITMPQLESSAIYYFNSLMKESSVHSVRYRVKDPEHVIEKIIRKRIQNLERVISITNYKTELTDLIGIRALHLFKEQWRPIHKFIQETYAHKDRPVINYRQGDPIENREELEKMGCDSNEHKYGYRSIHYIVETKPAKEIYYAEIQVRTIFEEAWSEIDHTIRYPYHIENPMFGQFLMILNRLTGSADEMGTYISFLKSHIEGLEQNHTDKLTEKDSIIAKLEKEINELNTKGFNIVPLTEALKKLRELNLDTNPYSSAFEAINKLNTTLYSHKFQELSLYKYNGLPKPLKSVIQLDNTDKNKIKIKPLGAKRNIRKKDE